MSDYLNIQEFISAVLIALTAVVYDGILIQSDMLFSNYFMWIDRISVRYKFLKHILMPLGLCKYCTFGQVALWYYVISCDTYNFITHIFFIATTLFFITILNNIHEWNNNR